MVLVNKLAAELTLHQLQDSIKMQWQTLMLIPLILTDQNERIEQQAHPTLRC